MDRETLSSYGWIIVTVIVIAAMIVLATTLTGTIENAIEGAVSDLQNMASDALSSAIK